MPEAFFGHPENLWINERIWGRTAREPLVSHRIREMAGYLKETLYDFVRRFDLKILVFENVLTIPMHVPLGVAIAELMSETHIPAIAHHHDFYWERTRYSVNAVNDLLDEVRRVLEDANCRQKMVDHNYRLATRYFSYAELRRCLRTLIVNIGNLYPTE